MSNKNIADLPRSDDKEFWDGEVLRYHPQQIAICETHHPDAYMDHTGYKDNHDGTVSCKFCWYGAKLPGYLKVKEGRLVDLRSL